MNQPDTQLGSALKSALSEGSSVEAASSSPAPATIATAVAKPAVATAVPVKTAAVAVKAAPAVAKASAPAPAKVAAPAKTSAPAKVAAPAKSTTQLDVGSVIANAAVGAATKTKAPDVLLPDHLVKCESPESTGEDSANPDRFTLEIFGSGCLVCRALVEDTDLEPLEELPKCHFARGVSLCPAKYIKIRAIGEQRVTARKLIKAQEAGDVLKFTRLLSDLSNRDAAFQAEVLKTAGITLGSATAASADKAEV